MNPDLGLFLFVLLVLIWFVVALLGTPTDEPNDPYRSDDF